MSQQGHGWVGDDFRGRMAALGRGIGMAEGDPELFAQVMLRFKDIEIPFTEAVPMAIGTVALKGLWHVYISDPETDLIDFGEMNKLKKNMKKPLTDDDFPSRV